MPKPTPTALPPESPPTPQPNPEDQESFNRLYRQINRRRWRNGLGVATSGSMSTVFPYMLGPMALSAYGLKKTSDARKRLAELEALGYRARRRDAVSGAVVGTLQKLPVTFLLWGHDELFFAADALLETFPAHPLLVEGAVEAVGAHADVLDVPVFGEMNGFANAGVEGLQGLLGIEGAESRIGDEAAGEVDDGGWHDMPENVAQNLVLVAPVAAAIDKASDYPFDQWDKRKPMKDLNGESSETPPPLPPRPRG